MHGVRGGFLCKAQLWVGIPFYSELLSPSHFVSQ